ncbi:hypothetical protein JHK87_023887 [Glycine soja]|nr:hypothetical protein JHK87_023887 [Glycine soja]
MASAINTDGFIHVLPVLDSKNYDEWVVRMEARWWVGKSSSFLYETRDNDRKGLIIILREKITNDNEELPYMMTVKSTLWRRFVVIGVMEV